jgi:hypothetical protein
MNNNKKNKNYRSRDNKIVTKSEVKSMIHSAFMQETETKWWPLAMGGATVDYSGNLYGLTEVPQGDADTQRDGDSINLDVLDIAYHVLLGDATNALRIIVFRWKELGSTPTAANIWTALGNDYTPYTVPVHDYEQTFTILHDELKFVDTYNPQNGGKIHLQLGGSKIQYAASGVSGSGKIFLYIVSDSAAATHPTFLGYSRLEFRDS